MAVAICTRDAAQLLGPAYQPDALANKAYRDMAEKVRVTENEDYERQYPARSLARITLRLFDMGSMAPMMALMGAIGTTQESKETATSYSRAGDVNGRLTREEYNSTSHSGRYSIMVAKRVMIEVSGSHVSMDDLKGAIAAVGVERIEGLLK